MTHYTIGPLKWEDDGNSHHANCGNLIQYRIWKRLDGMYEWDGGATFRIVLDWAPTLEAAKAAAQAHWESQLAECLTHVEGT